MNTREKTEGISKKKGKLSHLKRGIKIKIVRGENIFGPKCRH